MAKPFRFAEQILEIHRHALGQLAALSEEHLAVTRGALVRLANIENGLADRVAAQSPAHCALISGGLAALESLAAEHAALLQKLGVAA